MQEYANPFHGLLQLLQAEKLQSITGKDKLRVADQICNWIVNSAGH